MSTLILPIIDVPCDSAYARAQWVTTERTASSEAVFNANICGEKTARERLDGTAVV